MNRQPFRSAGAGVGVIVVSLRDGTTLYEKNAARPLVPASTMKVLTSAAALDRLGPDWRYETRLLSAAPVGPDGVLDGDLFVKEPAPRFVVERMQSSRRPPQPARIRGDVVADLLYFDEQRPPEWPHSSNPNPYAAPISALAANFSTVRVTVTPGPRLGAPAEILVEPLSDAILVSGRVKTTSTGRAVHASRRLERGGDGEVANRIVVSGRIGLYSGPWEAFLPIENPAAVAVAAVKRALQGAGIVVQGQARIGAAPEGAITLGSVPSKPLAEIVRDMNKHSQNFIAEMMQRTLGGEVFGPPASREKGARAVQAFLRSCGVDPQTVQLTDGSGLSRSNLLTAEALARVLVRMRSDARLEASFVESLPIGGVDGTLERRMYGSALGRVRAKTGSVAGVTALAGYVDDTSEGPVAFAFLVNGASHPRPARLTSLPHPLYAAPDARPPRRADHRPDGRRACFGTLRRPARPAGPLSVARARSARTPGSSQPLRRHGRHSSTASNSANICCASVSVLSGV
jgi:D-alanyl-D-alanine carboxypeptidase/D-alanyl-D-alanine-endopeptidase (penicillin-binding protein 4)